MRNWSAFILRVSSNQRIRPTQSTPQSPAWETHKSSTVLRDGGGGWASVRVYLIGGRSGAGHADGPAVYTLAEVLDAALGDKAAETGEFGRILHLDPKRVRGLRIGMVGPPRGVAEQGSNADQGGPGFARAPVLCRRHVFRLERARGTGPRDLRRPERDPESHKPRPRVSITTLRDRPWPEGIESDAQAGRGRPCCDFNEPASRCPRALAGKVRRRLACCDPWSRSDRPS